MNRLRLLIAIVAALSLGAGLLLRQETGVDEQAVLRELLPDEVFSGRTGAPRHYRSASGLAALNSHDAAPGVRGYASPIKVLLVLGGDGRIKGLKLLSHRETKSYVHYLETPAYLGQFIGKSVLDRFEIDRDIDGISRATVSVEALAGTVRDSSRALAAAAYGIRTPSTPDAGTGGLLWLWYGAVLAVGAAGYARTLRGGGFQYLRDISLAAGITVIGLILASPFSILHLFNLALGRPSTSMLWYVLTGSTLLSVLLAGRFYCGWLCPFGALSELVGRVPVRKWSIPTAHDDRWRKLKYIVLAFVMPLVFLTGQVDHGNYEVYVTLFAVHGSAFAWALTALMLLANVRVPLSLPGRRRDRSAEQAGSRLREQERLSHGEQTASPYVGMHSLQPVPSARGIGHHRTIRRPSCPTGPMSVPTREAPSRCPCIHSCTCCSSACWSRSASWAGTGRASFSCQLPRSCPLSR